MDERTIKIIEAKLNEIAEEVAKDGHKIMYAQGMAFVLDKIGYDVFWKDCKAKLVEVAK